jgi:hypothetical protein
LKELPWKTIRRLKDNTKMDLRETDSYCSDNIRTDLREVGWGV